TSAVTALAACVAILVYDVSSSRARLARDIGLLSDVVVKNLTASLAFADAGSAANTLQSVGVNEHIVSAHVLLADRSVFASYRRRAMPAAPFTVPANDVLDRRER